jgi:molybdopterin/thiamine biosynthesis adenylyltransferase
MNDEQLLRYSRHILLPEIGIEGQQRLLASRALLIGAGGLGSPAALYLASAGVGNLTVCDGDKVDLSNLQRQIVHREAAVGRHKAGSARETLLALNSQACISAITERVEGERLQSLIAQADVVIDASDNFATRHAVNRACVSLRKPLVSGAGIRFDGQLAVFDLRAADAPCYACLFPEEGEAEEMRCAVTGVFAPLVGIVGAMQAAEALKLLAGAGTTMSGRLLLIDALSMELRAVKLARDPGCRVCAGR